MISGGIARAGIWLTGAALLWAACDVLENKKFPPPNPPPVYDPGYYMGIGGQGYGGYPYGYGGSGYGGYGGFGGYGGVRPRPDAGIPGSGGTGLMCPPTAEPCISSCSSDAVFTSAPICDSTRGTWICPPGLVLRSSCPPGSCANTFLYCCDTVTGVRQPAGCTQEGVRGLCPATARRLTDDACIPDGLGVSTCIQLQYRDCTLSGQQCHSGGYDCSCSARGDGGMEWVCGGLI